MARQRGGERHGQHGWARGGLTLTRASGPECINMLMRPYVKWSSPSCRCLMARAQLYTMYKCTCPFPPPPSTCLWTSSGHRVVLIEPSSGPSVSSIIIYWILSIKIQGASNASAPNESFLVVKWIADIYDQQQQRRRRRVFLWSVECLTHKTTQAISAPATSLMWLS